MDNFRIIYKVLKAFEKAMDLEEFDKDVISKESLGITEARWCRIIALLVEEGYLKGIEVWNSFDREYPKVSVVRPEITLKGLEYLEENTFMKKAAEMAKGIAGVIPKI